MCTVIVRVPDDPRHPTRVLAVRDEDPEREWNPLGDWWPEAHPGVIGVRDVRAGGAWLAAAP
ncbi:NRDE family protein, partial [Pseudomonas sp. MPR-AND1A]